MGAYNTLHRVNYLHKQLILSDPNHWKLCMVSYLLISIRSIIFIQNSSPNVCLWLFIKSWWSNWLILNCMIPFPCSHPYYKLGSEPCNLHTNNSDISCYCYQLAPKQIWLVGENWGPWFTVFKTKIILRRPKKYVSTIIMYNSILQPWMWLEPFYFFNFSFCVYGVPKDDDMDESRKDKF